MYQKNRVPWNKQEKVAYGCECCGEVFFARINENKLYCSKKCSDIMLRTRTTGDLSFKKNRICKLCNKEFRCDSWSGNTFCSRECYHKAQKKHPDWFLEEVGYFVECAYCGKIVKKPMSELKNRSNIYCSRKCARQPKPGKNTKCRRDMIPQLRNWRSKVVKRDNFTCQYCHEYLKGSKDLHAHHIKAFKDYPEEGLKVENGIALCKKCHLEIHNFDVLAQQ